MTRWLNGLCRVAVLVVVVLVAPGSVFAQGYRITANIIDMWFFSYITGEVRDNLGTGVSGADLYFDCPGSRIRAITLPDGSYLGDSPPCSNMGVTAYIAGKKLGKATLSTVQTNTPYSITIEIPPNASLAEVIATLQLASGRPVTPTPYDHVPNGKRGLDDAAYGLQELAGLRADRFSLSLPSGRSTMAVALSASTVKIGRDSDNDGVDDWFADYVTDANGYFQSDELPNGLYSLTAINGDGSKGRRIGQIRIFNAAVRLGTVRLKPMGTISGTVRLEGQTDHSDIHVFIPGTSFGAYTDSNGQFTMSYVAEGTYTLKAVSDGYGTVAIPNVPVESAKQTTVADVTMASVVGSVSGTFWTQNSADYAGTLVSLRLDAGPSFLTVTDDQANYSFTDVPIGSGTIGAVHPGYVSQQYAVTVAAGSNAQSDRMLLTNSSLGTLNGTVTLNNRSDHSGIMVSLAGIQFAATTNSAGAFAISGIPAGTYTIFLKAEGYGAEKVEGVQIQSQQTTTLPAKTLAALTGQAKGSVVGRAVYLGQSTQSGILITLEPNAEGIPPAATDTQGGYIFKNVPPGVYTLSLANYPDYKTVVMHGIQVSPWETATVETVTLIPPRGTIRGKVLLEGATSHDNVTVSVDGTSISAQTLADGSFVLEDVLEGTVNLTAYKAGFETVHLTGVTVTGGQTAIVEAPFELNQPPVAPTGLTTAQLSGSTIKASWLPSASTDVAGYDVYYGTSADQITTKANTALVTSTYIVEDPPNPPITRYYMDVSGLSKGTTYFFAVKAVDADGLQSPVSQSTWKEIIPYSPAPPAPNQVLWGQYPFAWPEQIAIEKNGIYAYVTNPYNNVVSLIDLGNATVLGMIAVGQVPRDVVANSQRNEVYCVNRDSHSITVIDSTQAVASQAVIATIAVGSGTYPSSLAVSPDGALLFVGCSGGGNSGVRIFDLNTRAQIATSPIALSHSPVAMAIANGKLYVAGELSNDIDVIDIADGSPTRWQLKPYTITAGSSPSSIKARPDGLYLYVANGGSDNVSVINTTTDQAVGTPLAVGDYPVRMAASGSILYVVNFSNDNVSMINTASQTVLGTTFAAGDGPMGIAVTADGEKIYVVNNVSQTVSIRMY